ncbi:MAG: sigma-54 dependent transcriptional regulator [Kofleriaceae bacterium]
MDWIAFGGELLQATSTANTPRALALAIATTLEEHVAITRLELDQPTYIALEHVDGAWRVIESSRPDPDGTRSVDRRERPSSTRNSVDNPRASEFTTRVRVMSSRKLVIPADARELLEAIVASACHHVEVVQRVATSSRAAHVELRSERERSGTALIARSAAMRAVLTRVELVASHPTTVSITGESGVGKELVAREIHRLSPRTRQPFVALNCGALPDALIESELFGHERGAFTGADRQHAGAFERAHRGTLFLDEVGELSAKAQTKLLRVLQERQVRRVGGTGTVDIDVRVITATNRSLATSVDTGEFREDLYYRLAVFAIHVPPLRERRDDFAPLVTTILDELTAKLGVRTPAITRDFLRRLETHAWPGNVRELRNVLEAFSITGELPETRRSTRGRNLDDSIRTAIEDALRATRGKIYGDGSASQRLGLPPGTLQSKMKKLGIRRADFT